MEAFMGAFFGCIAAGVLVSALAEVGRRAQMRRQAEIAERDQKIAKEYIDMVKARVAEATRFEYPNVPGTGGTGVN